MSSSWLSENQPSVPRQNCFDDLMYHMYSSQLQEKTTGPSLSAHHCFHTKGAQLGDGSSGLTAARRAGSPNRSSELLHGPPGSLTSSLNEFLDHLLCNSSPEANVNVPWESGAGREDHSAVLFKIICRPRGALVCWPNNVSTHKALSIQCNSTR